MQTVTLTLPARLYLPIRRIARATHQPVETVLLKALQSSLPSLDGLSASFKRELIRLEALDDNALRRVMLEMVPTDLQQEINDLLEHNQAGMITPSERERLTVLQEKADQVMLRKARAAVLLRFRGQRLPTLAELRRLTLATRGCP
jgi:hypothetical protein